MPLEIVTVPCLSDNYAYLLHNSATGQTAVVDAPEASAIRAALEHHNWGLDEILLTHHHWDHINGTDELRNTYGAKVTGAQADKARLPQLDRAVTDGERFELFGQPVDVMDVSGHTVGHVAFYLPDSHAAFTADSLMALGCGRLFEGTPAQMWESLSKLAKLPEQTLIYSGHEYTQSNAAFAVTIEPENAALSARLIEIDRLRDAGKPTVPASLAIELRTNPFLRAHLPEVQENLNLAGAQPVDVFTEIRKRKDNF